MASFRHPRAKATPRVRRASHRPRGARCCVVSAAGAVDTEVGWATPVEARAGRAAPGQAPSSFLSAASGSATPAVAGRSGPCASRVTRGGVGGASSVAARSAVRTSSGRTAGVVCRTTTRSIAQSGRWRRLGGHRHDGRPHVEGLRAGLEGPGHLDPVDARAGWSAAPLELLGGDPAEVDHPVTGLQPVGERTGGGLDHLEHVEPLGQRLVEGRAAPTRGRPARSPRSRSTRPRWRCRSAPRWRS